MQITDDTIRKTIADNGNMLKVLGKTDSELRVGNYIVMWDGVVQDELSDRGSDLHGERFAPDVVLDSAYTRAMGRIAVDWEHGFEPHPAGPGRDDVLGYRDFTTLKRDERGAWMESVLDRRNEYMEFIETLIEEGMIGTSSETTEAASRTADGTITRWPLKRDTLTVQPAEPRMMTENALAAIKSLTRYSPRLKALLQQESGIELSDSQAEREGATDPAQTGLDDDPKTDTTQGATTMTTEQAPPETAPAEIKSLDELLAAQAENARGISGLTEAVNALLQFAQDSPGVRNAGVFTHDGGDADQTVKSFTDFLMAVRRGDMKRLQAVYETGLYKDMTEGQASQGAVLVPREFVNDLIQFGAGTSQIVSRVQTFPVGSDAGDMPALDQFTAPTTAGSGQTALAAGIITTATGEGGTLTETQPTFRMVSWKIYKTGGYVEVTNELAADSPQSVEALLRMLFAIAIVNKKERDVIRGTGAGEGLGMLNADALINVTPATNNLFALADSLSMISRFKKFSAQPPVWIIHPGIWPDIGVFESSSGGGVWQANHALAQPQALHGYEILESEHSPQDDNSGCVLLADLGAMALFDRMELAIAFSEHAAFTTDKGTWRFISRYDVQPWVTDAITLADPQGSYTVSPFVSLND